MDKEKTIKKYQQEIQQLKQEIRNMKQKYLDTKPEKRKKIIMNQKDIGMQTHQCTGRVCQTPTDQKLSTNCITQKNAKSAKLLLFS